MLWVESRLQMSKANQIVDENALLVRALIALLETSLSCRLAQCLAMVPGTRVLVLPLFQV